MARREVGELAQRLVQLKDTEAERMNEVNKICEQMVSPPAAAAPLVLPTCLRRPVALPCPCILLAA